jgi:hypothetical protein
LSLQLESTGHPLPTGHPPLAIQWHVEDGKWKVEKEIKEQI